jgi:hypothetical protein
VCKDDIDPFPVQDNYRFRIEDLSTAPGYVPRDDVYITLSVGECRSIFGVPQSGRITELFRPAVSVSAITVDPPSNLVSSNLGAREVIVNTGTGITTVTFTNRYDRSVGKSLGGFAINDQALGTLDVVRVTGTVVCGFGDEFRLSFRLRQGVVEGQGRLTGTCTGSLQSFQARVVSNQGVYEDGPAEVTVRAEIGHKASRYVSETDSLTETVDIVLLDGVEP